jgi:hypothetical protein
MTALAFRLELRRSRTVAFWMAVIVLAYGAIIAAMYPILEENAQAYRQHGPAREHPAGVGRRQAPEAPDRAQLAHSPAPLRPAKRRSR